MSSFLDFTGLNRLVTKLKAYFMKKPTTASTSSYPLVGYDSTNNVGKYNSDITLDMANREILAGNSTPNIATPAAPYSNNITMRTVTSNVRYTSQYHKPTKDMYALIRNGGSAAISVIYGTTSSTSTKSLSPGYMILLLYTTSNETWSLVAEPALSGGTYPSMTVGNVSNVVPIEKLPTASSIIKNDTTHVPTADAVYIEFNKKLDRTCSAVSHGIENTGNENYYKFTSCELPDTNTNRNGTFLIVAVGERKENQVLAILKVNLRTFTKTDNVISSEVGAYLYVISDPNNNFKNNRFSVHYSVTNTWKAVLELWIGCNMRYGGVSVTELNSGHRLGMQTSQWTYYSGAFTTLPSGAVTITPLRLLSCLNSGVGAPNQPIHVSSYGTVEPCSTYISMGTAVADSNVLCVF